MVAAELVANERNPRGRTMPSEYSKPEVKAQRAHVVPIRPRHPAPCPTPVYAGALVRQLSHVGRSARSRLPGRRSRGHEGGDSQNSDNTLQRRDVCKPSHLTFSQNKKVTKRVVGGRTPAARRVSSISHVSQKGFVTARCGRLHAPYGTAAVIPSFPLPAAEPRASPSSSAIFAFRDQSFIRAGLLF